jgi:cytochrome c
MRKRGLSGRSGPAHSRPALLTLGAVTLAALVGPASAAGEAEKGKAVFAAHCGICHQVGPGAQNVVGPELNGIVGKKAASVAGYAGYSAGMKKLGEDGFVWTDAHIDQWIADPKAMLPDSVMAQAFQGLKDADQRADVIAYLKTQQ